MKSSLPVFDVEDLRPNFNERNFGVVGGCRLSDEECAWDAVVEVSSTFMTGTEIRLSSVKRKGEWFAGPAPQESAVARESIFVLGRGRIAGMAKEFEGI